ncbi:lysoplasmalogenase [Tumebacillus sp. DT12]|uniref:Lysoplasmalogenase n=1 Tax=Tumebacillus lacus TaxID=2995335 RepID=A0ABT3X1X4_9BACL|nr:lysoplasmalogenase [Tumebacillus lacus]MCX7570915.1 lysoplasmalogenase [Tumebacillus lacus]
MIILTGVAIGSGLMDLFAISRGWTKARYVWKPFTMILIIVLAFLGADWSNDWHRWLLAGLVLSLAGDVFLVLPSDRFLAGLSSFFAAHVCYIAAFADQGDNEHAASVAVVLTLLGLLSVAVLRRGVLASGGMGLLVAVMCYITVILIMVWRAFLTGDAFMLAGAALFLISDSVLAWNRFIKPSLTAELTVMATYYSAQLLLAWSLL